MTHAPADIAPRIYTASALAADAPHYLALPSRAFPIPFYSEMDMYLPHWREYLRWVRRDGVEVLHLTTPGPLGLTALWVAARTGLPLVGSFHTDLATYTTVLSGSKWLGSVMAVYMRWMYGRCMQDLVPSAATRELMAARGSDVGRIGLWTRGVDTALFDPSRRSAALRERWRASERQPALLYVGRLSREKGLQMLPELQYRLRAMAVGHRMIIAGDGPLRRWLADRLPEASLHRRARPQRRSPRSSRAPTRSCSRAPPTRPATSCSKPRPRASRLSSAIGVDRRRTCSPASPVGCARAAIRGIGQLSSPTF